MKIGIISDTHIQDNPYRLPAELVKALKGCSLILHAGDLVNLCVLEELKKISNVEAVHGNMDHPKVQSLLPDKKILTIEGKKICLTHGHGSPDRLIDVLKEECVDLKPDIIVFGHSHMPMNELREGILFLNPGSATDTVFAPYRSYGIIEISNGRIKAEIHRLKG